MAEENCLCGLLRLEKQMCPFPSVVWKYFLFSFQMNEAFIPFIS